jgi:hypothetical protein
MKHEVQRLAAVLMLIAAAYFIADAVEKRSAAQTEIIPPAEQSSGCAGGAISFTPQADGTVIVTCPEGSGK